MTEDIHRELIWLNGDNASVTAIEKVLFAPPPTLVILGDAGMVKSDFRVGPSRKHKPLMTISTDRGPEETASTKHYDFGQMPKPQLSLAVMRSRFRSRTRNAGLVTVA